MHREKSTNWCRVGGQGAEDVREDAPSVGGNDSRFATACLVTKYLAKRALEPVTD
jgi:hypothetical protein